MASSLFIATFWSTFQRFGSLGISFVSNMVLARLLCPDDFGLVAFIMIFVGIADLLVDGGMGNALIQKKEITEKDINTVFTLNIILSLFFFVVLFCIAPLIQQISAISHLAICLRVQSISILLKSLYVVPFSILNREISFKKLAIIGLFANSIATALAICSAYYGWSYWSLIFRNIFLDTILFVSYFWITSYRPIIGIWKDSFRALFSYGFFVAFANILEYLYSNIITFIIGKRYTVKELGYYQQAYSLQQIPVFSLSAIINQVFLPFLSKLQDSVGSIRERVITTITIVTFFVFPALTYLIILAKPIIILLYSDKWLPSVPLFQVVCIAGLFNALIHLCRSVLKAIGKTKALFMLQVITIIIGLVLVFLFVQFDLQTFVYVVALNGVIAYLLVGIYMGYYLRFSIFKQILCFLPNLLLSIFSGLIIYFVFLNKELNIIPLIMISFLIYSIIYFGLHYLFKTQSVIFLINKLNKK